MTTTVRRVRRIIRRVDPWTVFKVSGVFALVGGLAIVLGLVVFWSVIRSAGIPEKITQVLIDITLLKEGAQPFASDEFFLRVALFGTVVWAALTTGLATLSAVMYNLIADVVGGVEITVLEETLVAAPVVVPSRAAAAASVTADLPTEESPLPIAE